MKARWGVLLLCQTLDEVHAGGLAAAGSPLHPGLRHVHHAGSGLLAAAAQPGGAEGPLRGVVHGLRHVPVPHHRGHHRDVYVA